MAKPLEILMEKYIVNYEHKLIEAPIKIKKELVRRLEKYNDKLKAFYKNRGDKSVYPFIAMLGKNKDGIIAKVVPIKGKFKEGCYLVPKVSPEEMSKAIMLLLKQGYDPCGILRVMNNTVTEHMSDTDLIAQGSLVNAVGNDFKDIFYRNPNFINMTIAGEDNLTIIESAEVSYRKYTFYLYDIEEV